MNTYKKIVLLSSAILLNACLFGDGNENSPVHYNGKTTPAEITKENGKEIATNGLSNQSLGGASANIDLVAVEPSIDSNFKSSKVSIVPVTVKIAQLFKESLGNPDNLNAASIGVAAAITTASGTCGGTYVLDRSESNNDFFATFENYCEGSTTISGSMSVTGNTFSYSQLRIRSVEYDVSMNGSMTFDTINPGNTGSMSFVANMDFRDNITNTTGRLEEYTITANIGDTDFFITINGRIYHSDYGYVDITTITPLSFDSSTLELTGEIRFVGQNSAVTLKFLSNGNFRLTVENSGRIIETQDLTIEDIFAEI